MGAPQLMGPNDTPRWPAVLRSRRRQTAVSAGRYCTSARNELPSTLKDPDKLRFTQCRVNSPPIRPSFGNNHARGVLLWESESPSHVGSMSYPYTLISCPCSADQQPGSLEQLNEHRRTSQHPGRQDELRDEVVETEPFNPSQPRSAFSIYNYESLLFCGECHQIRCPRCWSDEIVQIYCPSCLCKTVPSAVKTDGNR